MKPEIKDKWLAALRSGDYKQTTQGYLRLEEDCTTSFCCLGVLADTVGASWIEGVLPDGSFFNKGDFLSTEALDFVGLSDEDQKGFEAAAKLFDIEQGDADWLFCDSSYINEGEDLAPGPWSELMVAARIREFVADRRPT